MQILKDAFAEVLNRQPTAEELHHLENQYASIHHAYEYALGVNVPEHIALERMNFVTPYIRYSSSNGADWAMYLDPKLLIELGKEQDFVTQLYKKHLGREPDEEGAAWWKEQWERQFLTGIRAD